jgi:anti-anti-sigma factor
MYITHQHLAGHVYLVNINGPLNVTHASHLNRYWVHLAGKGVKRVVVDLAEVPFIDGPGLKALITGYKLFGRDNFRLVRLQTQPKLVLELTGFEQFLPVSSTRNIKETIETFETLPGYMLNLEPRTMALVDIAA